MDEKAIPPGYFCQFVEDNVKWPVKRSLLLLGRRPLQFQACSAVVVQSAQWFGRRVGLKASDHGLADPCVVSMRKERIMRWAAIGLPLLVLAGCSTVPTSFSPRNSIPVGEFSHQTFDELLRAHVQGGSVDYPGIGANGRLSSYLASLDRVDPNAFASSGRLAFWINSYNAFAIKGILDRGSPLTLWGRYRYFIAREYRVGGEAVNLYDLERRILIPFHDPRIHFAIVCASASCPRLQSWAYQPERIDEQLDHVARLFVNDPERNRFDRQRRIAYLSKIFDWFAEDFVDQSGSLQRYVRKYVDDPELAKELDNVPYTVEFLDYDWSLNGIPPRKDQHDRSTS